MAALIRPATSLDAKPILEIYAPLVRHTFITFEVEPPTESEMRRRISEKLHQFPWLVYEQDGKVVGSAHAGPHRERAAYRWAADVSVYVDSGAHRRGIGRGLYAALFLLLKRQGYCNLYAGIALPNAASVGLHEAMGFQPLGIYRSVGFKLGEWRDVGWWELFLQDHAAEPAPPVDFATLQQDGKELQSACAAGLAAMDST